MRQAAYLSTSRHGIFYHRLPIPPHLHPRRKLTDLKVTLGTRCPKVACRLSRTLVASVRALHGLHRWVFKQVLSRRSARERSRNAGSKGDRRRTREDGSGSEKARSRAASVVKLRRSDPSAISISASRMRPVASALAHQTFASSRVTISKKAASSPLEPNPRRPSASDMAQSTISGSSLRVFRCSAGITRSGRS